MGEGVEIDASGPDPAAQDERDRLCDLIVHLVGERGYAETSVELVLERSGVERANFERHFRDLEDACCVAYEGLSLQFAQGMVAAFIAAEAEEWVDQIRAAGTTLYRYVVKDMTRARFIYVEFPTISRRAKALRDRTMRSLTTLIDRGRFELDDPDSMSHATAEAIAGAMYDRVREAVRDGDVERGPQIAADVTYMSIQPYLGAEAALKAMEHPLD